MKAYFQDSRGAAQYVEERLLNSKIDSPLIMIITPEKCGVYSVSDVTNSVLVETALALTQSIFKEWLNTLQQNTPAG